MEITFVQKKNLGPVFHINNPVARGDHFWGAPGTTFHPKRRHRDGHTGAATVQGVLQRCGHRSRSRGVQKAQHRDCLGAWVPTMGFSYQKKSTDTWNENAKYDLRYSKNDHFKEILRKDRYVLFSLTGFCACVHPVAYRLAQEVHRAPQHSAAASLPPGDDCTWYSCEFTSKQSEEL